MSRSSTLQSRLALLERRLGAETFTLNDDAAAYPCACSVVGTQTLLDIGGRETVIRARLWVRRQALGAATLSSGDRLTFRATQYRVAMVDDIESGLYQLHLGDANS
jgi:hypothetical protein